MKNKAQWTTGYTETLGLGGLTQDPGFLSSPPSWLHEQERELAPALFVPQAAALDQSSGYSATAVCPSLTPLRGGYTTMNSMAAFGWNFLSAWERSPRQKAVSARSALEYVGGLATEALGHRAVRHPYLDALASGDLPDPRWALADFARHYPGYARHFPRYLTTVISRLTDARHRDDLLENLTEESGIYEEGELAELREHGIETEWIFGEPHPRLFDRFRTAMGVEDSEQAVEPDQVICWREMFLSLLANGSPVEAVGALGLGTEQIVSTIYQPFTKAIDRLGDLDPRDSVFFPLHTAVDDHHQETLQKVAADMVTDDRTARELRRGMLKALNLRSTFWDWMYSRALNPTHAGHTLS